MGFMGPGQRPSGHTAFVATLSLALLAACAPDRASAPSPTISTDREQVQVQPGLARLQHVVVIYLENHSFDNLYGEFPGANGLSNDAGSVAQVDSAGKPS